MTSSQVSVVDGQRSVSTVAGLTRTNWRLLLEVEVYQKLREVVAGCALLQPPFAVAVQGELQDECSRLLPGRLR
jgi:hypothetical protein